MEDVATSHCVPMQLFAPLSGRRSLKFAGRAVGYDDLADDCSFNVVHAFNHASSHRREALEAHGTVVARVSFLPPCKGANSGQRHCIYRISCARFTWLKSIMMFLMLLHQRLETTSPLCHAVDQCWVLPPVQFNVHLDR